MKKTLLFACLLLTLGLNAQTTVTNSIFLTGGDTLERSVTVNIGTATVTPPASNAQNWDMSFLTTDFTVVDSVRYAASGMAYNDFPTTEIIVSVIGFGQGYVDVDTNSMTMIGAALELFGLSFVAPFSNPQTLQTAPLTYGSTTNDTHAMIFSQHVDSVPGLRDLINQLGLSVNPDSIRLNLTGTTNLQVDAYGDLVMFDTTYDVIRQKSVVMNDIKIEIWVPAFGSGFWVDITSTVSGMLPFPLKDTTYRYDFLTEGSKIPVVRFEMDPTGTNINSIEFKGYNESTSVFNTAALKEVSVFPNPTSNILNIKNEIEGNFNLTIIDGMGRVLVRKNDLNGELVQLNLSEMPQGNFYLILSDKNGQLLSRKTISVIK
jgi:hypothetical protein